MGAFGPYKIGEYYTIRINFDGDQESDQYVRFKMNYNVIYLMNVCLPEVNQSRSIALLNGIGPDLIRELTICIQD